MSTDSSANARAASPEPSSVRLPATRAENVALAITIALVLGAIALESIWRIEPRSGLAFFLATILVAFGAIHGATDFWVARSRLRTITARITYLLLYVTIVLAALLALFTAPMLSMSGMLLLGAWHFGVWHVGAHCGMHDSTDSCSESFVWRIARHIAAISIGAVPIVAAVYFQPLEAARVFAVLLGNDALSIVGAWQHPITLTTFASGLLMWCVLCWKRSGGTSTEFARSVLHIALSALVFAAFPLLLAFAIFFALLHAPLHSRDVLSLARPARNRALLEAIFLTILALAILLPAYVLLLKPTSATAMSATALSMLLVLTVSHALNATLIRVTQRIFDRHS
jgi:Brp/Blh family beta-carotene 15,15'-monooxygenase